jgi:hypothetical protein
MSQPTLPKDDLLAGWREACLAYRRVRHAGYSDLPARDAAERAFREMHPTMTREEASAEVARAVQYASVTHSAWFWRGVGDMTARRWDDGPSG